MPFSWAALSAADPPPCCAVGRANGATTTVLHPEPTTFGAPDIGATDWADGLTAVGLAGVGLVLVPPLGAVSWSDSVTLVPAGGVKANCRASGLAKSTAVKPTSNAGFVSFVE